MFPHIGEIRDILEEENKKDVRSFRDLDWRLNLVTSCRARQKIMIPKYTVRLELQNEGNAAASDKIENLVMDVDYTNLKRIQQEIEDALKSVDSTYSKKVFKFLK